MARNASRLAAGQDKILEQHARAGAELALEQGLQKNLSSPGVANRMFREIKRITGVEDPYAEVKAKEMEQARKACAQASKHLKSDLASLVSLAVLGNSLDFFVSSDTVLAGVEKQAAEGALFHHNDVPLLEKALAQNPKRLLYLTDNAGEIFFDLPLYDYLRGRAEKVVLAVKGGPALNDLTRADLAGAGLSQRFDEVADTGFAGLGVEWPRVSPDFKRLFSQADLVLSKGMANFETLHGRKLKPPVFYLFKLKCQPLRDHLQAPPDSYWALWQEGYCKQED
jgi:uncharacterized protein with ATP-grasp and redox domains